MPILKGLAPIAALLLLNAMLGFENGSGTPAIRLEPRLAPEFVALWLLLLVAIRALGAVPKWLVTSLAIVCTFLVIGRYLDVTAPVLFGRAINLYWDVPQLPRFLSVIGQPLAGWQQLLVASGVVLVLWGLYRLLRALIGILARRAAPVALRSTPALVATAGAVVLVAAYAVGVPGTRALVSEPVTPTYARQAELLLSAFLPGRLASALPPSPPFDSDLAVLRGLDVKLLVLESYGAIAFDHPESRRRLAAARDTLARTIAATGRQEVSAFVRSPTFGGASDLAHLSLLSGIDLSDPRRHDLLLTSDRPTLLGLFERHGYRTYGFYPALSWDWPERVYYGFDEFLDGPGLGYQGPEFGPWFIPDQYSMARLDELHPIGPDTPPRLLFFPTITSHFPFRQVPPYQPDWSRLLSAQPFESEDVERALAYQVGDWMNLLPEYLRTIEYTYAWLAGYLEQPSPRDYLMILVGDHQPASSVTGPDGPWDVPVHIITSRSELVERFRALGFQPGLEPRRPVLGGMHELTWLLADAFDSQRSLGSLRGVPAKPVPARQVSAGTPSH
ncbi:MAG: sulfatase-like hydrolase/transferase [Chromatiaceae bacterium]|nr:sulfatase-like hydrolase/transferase [Chromatiaceae bacterium]